MISLGKVRTGRERGQLRLSCENQLQIKCEFGVLQLIYLSRQVRSRYPTMSQQFLGFKKLSFVGATSGFKTPKKLKYKANT